MVDKPTVEKNSNSTENVETNNANPHPAPVVINQPPTAAEADAAGPNVELSYGEGAAGGGSGWTSWGLSWGQSLISGAKSGVTVLAKELGDGIGTVSRTVESVLDAPSPEDMASDGGAATQAATEDSQQQQKPQEQEQQEGKADQNADSGSESGWLKSSWRVGGALTSSVTQTGSYLVTGGLDLLETLGKRTMDALQETDPGFQRTKAKLSTRPGMRPTMAEILARLERVRAEPGDDEAEDSSVKPETLEAALAALPDQFGPANAWLSKAVAADCLPADSGDGEEGSSDKDIVGLQVDCVRRLAALTAATMHYLLKAASLASAAAEASSDSAAAAAADSATKLVGLCFALIGCADAVRERACILIQAAASGAEGVEASAATSVDEHAVNQAMTQVILEAEGAKAYLQDAFLLLAPVLQLAALEEPVATATRAKDPVSQLLALAEEQRLLLQQQQKQQSSSSESATSNNLDPFQPGWLNRLALCDSLSRLLFLDMETALDRKFEQELWNVCFKEPVAAAQREAKLAGSSGQAKLAALLEYGIGFYTNLLHELCTVFQVSLPCRKRQSHGPVLEPVVLRVKAKWPTAGSLAYLCQHCLVHLGDLCRYQRRLDQAKLYYNWAVQTCPSNGHPFNQLAILASQEENR
uniref:TPR_REGION domain-containing protein n=1 Tax=Macrostomum lignano TaxID=282301 RepID=A0A1I8IM91_9PLAT